MTTSSLHLFLFMTDGMSLAAWRDAGMLHRELALYKELAPHLQAITVVSYGEGSDDAIAKEAGLEVIVNRWRLPPALYLRLLPWLCRWRLRGRPLIKTNQTQGGEFALAVARRLAWPMIARCGFPLASFMERISGPDSAEAQAMTALEGMVFRGADHGIVTTSAIRDDITARHSLPAGKISVVPNYVDTDLFRPDNRPVAPRRGIITVGRLTEQKNHSALIEACAKLRQPLVIIGDGPLKPDLTAQAQCLGAEVSFPGVLPHTTLPKTIGAAAIFALPSHYEGHPKALMEAMALGMPVVAARSPGIDGVVSDGNDGLSCGVDSDSLAEALARLLDDSSLRDRLGAAAHQTAIRQWSLPVIRTYELDVYARVAGS